MNAESFIQAVAPLMKAQGFKKSNATWRRSGPESIAVFNVQKSPWGGCIYYINVGLYFHDLGSLLAPPENKCHVQRRLDVEAPSLVVAEALGWFRERARLSDATRLAEADSTKGLVFKEVKGAR
jgi:hypothetical protein